MEALNPWAIEGLVVGIWKAQDLTLLEKSPQIVAGFLLEWVAAAGGSFTRLPCISVVILGFNFWSIILICLNLISNFKNSLTVCTALITPTPGFSRLPWFFPGTAALPISPKDCVMLLISALTVPLGVSPSAATSHKIICVALGLLPPQARNWLLAAIAANVHLTDNVGIALRALKAVVPKKNKFDHYLSFALWQRATPLWDFLLAFLAAATELDLPKEAKMAVLFVAVDVSITALAPWTTSHALLESLVTHLLDLTSQNGSALIPKRPPAMSSNLAVLLLGLLPLPLTKNPTVEPQSQKIVTPAKPAPLLVLYPPSVCPVDVVETSCIPAGSSSLAMLHCASPTLEPLSIVDAQHSGSHLVSVPKEISTFSKAVGEAKPHLEVAPVLSPAVPTPNLTQVRVGFSKSNVFDQGNSLSHQNPPASLAALALVPSPPSSPPQAFEFDPQNPQLTEKMHLLLKEIKKETAARGLHLASLSGTSAPKEKASLPLPHERTRAFPTPFLNRNGTPTSSLPPGSGDPGQSPPKDTSLQALVPKFASLDVDNKAFSGYFLFFCSDPYQK